MSEHKSTDTLILGCGYLGIQVAKTLVFSGTRVWAVTRNPLHADRFRRQGILPIVADWTAPRTLSQLPSVARILVAISYDRNSPHNRFDSQVGGLRNLLRATPLAANICYISTTGVYHYNDGRWVDEASPCRPEQESGQAHLAAERLLHRLRPDSPWTVLRLAGIYGPGRIPRVDDVIAGRPIASPQTGYLNLIHVADAAAAAISSWQNSRQRTYVVSDDQPVIRGDFYCTIAKQFNAPQPIFVSPPAGAAVNRRATSNKRVWNRALKRDLLPKLTYPTFVAGIQHAATRSFDCPRLGADGASRG
jgi:nucleoside-diphosphate-sugar epimerase